MPCDAPVMTATFPSVFMALSFMLPRCWWNDGRSVRVASVGLARCSDRGQRRHPAGLPTSSSPCPESPRGLACIKVNNCDMTVLDMGNIDLTALEIFKTVAEQGGIAKAAGRLHRVPSNVTTRVKQLEERLGTKLFLRGHRRLVLSAGRRRSAPPTSARPLPHPPSEAEAALRSDAPAGALQIGALESTAATRLPPILARYHRKYPDVRLELVTGTTGALVVRVLGHEIEAA